MRARRIARTETVTAANGAAHINALDTGIDKNGIWLSVHDDRTRHAHAEADEQKVRINEPFKVGGELLMYPGAPTQSNGYQLVQRTV